MVCLNSFSLSWLCYYYQARIQDFVQRGARKNAENQGHSSMEANFEARNETNCMKLWYAREGCCKLSSIELEMYKQYIDDALQILKLVN